MNKRTKEPVKNEASNNNLFDKCVFFTVLSINSGPVQCAMFTFPRATLKSQGYDMRRSEKSLPNQKEQENVSKFLIC